MLEKKLVGESGKWKMDWTWSNFFTGVRSRFDNDPVIRPKTTKQKPNR